MVLPWSVNYSGDSIPGRHQMPDANYPYIRRVCSPIRSGSGFACHPTALEKFLCDIFLKKIGSTPPFSGSVHVFLQFSFDKKLLYAV
jgi:hypothetical protein